MAEILLQHFFGATEQNHAKISSEIIYVLAEIRNVHLLNASLRTYRCTDLLSMIDKFKIMFVIKGYSAINNNVQLQKLYSIELNRS